MNTGQIERFAMIFIGIAIGISMSGGLIPKIWENIAALVFLILGVWFYIFPPKFLEKLKIFS